MAQISRIYSFNDVVDLVPGQVEAEIFNFVNSWNNHDKGIAQWNNIVMGPSDGIQFYSASGLLVSTIKYTINNFTINGDSTNGVNINGNGGNICLGETAGSYGGGSKILFIPDRSVAPTSNPTAGFIFYSNSGHPKVRTSAGDHGDVVLTEGTQTLPGQKTLSNAAGNPIHGTNTNDNASAGYVGETTSATASLTNFPSTGAYGDLTSLSLTAGDWLVTAAYHMAPGTADVDTIIIGISTTSGDSTTGLTTGDNRFVRDVNSNGTSLQDDSLYVPSYRMSLSGTTTVYLKYSGVYSTSTPQAEGRISAVRIR